MKNNNRKITTPQSLNAYIKSICDIMRRSGRTGALQYVPELTWMLFLRILDEREQKEEEAAKALSVPFRPSLEYPYRWQDWASPNGKKRIELQQGTLGAFMSFVNGELIPYLRNLKNKPGATSRQKVISEVFSSTERTYIDTERNLLDILDKIDALSVERVDETHMFPISQVYEGLLQKMGEKNNDGGQFFTPREVIRVMVKVINPEIGETVYDPCCGTGGFLAQAYQHMKGKVKTATDMKTLKTRTFYGREKENLVYPIALANLVLQGIDEPHIWHGNTLTGLEVYGGLFSGAPPQFDVILTNPPFGGKEGKDAQTQFFYKTSSTQVLFLQHVIDSLKRGGRCGIVMDEGVLFRTNENAFVQTKRKLLNECNLWCIVSLPPKVFVNAGAASKTNLLFFTKGKSTEEIWYYDLSDLNITKKQPLTIQHFDEFFRLLPERGASERSWRVKRKEIEAKNYDLKAVNPNRKEKEDKRTPDELISIIESQAEQIKKSIKTLRGK
ncbi:MAG: type I restriction-modification system subunit M [Candidatus Omnitrophica bacterium]|nr:type I restriction-modification system subunit M [Candidatus Omnitrophota bacterium]